MCFCTKMGMKWRFYTNEMLHKAAKTKLVEKMTPLETMVHVRMGRD